MSRCTRRETRIEANKGVVYLGASPGPSVLFYTLKGAYFVGDSGPAGLAFRQASGFPVGCPDTARWVKAHFWVVRCSPICPGVSRAPRGSTGLLRLARSGIESGIAVYDAQGRVLDRSTGYCGFATFWRRFIPVCPGYVGHSHKVYFKGILDTPSWSNLTPV